MTYDVLGLLGLPDHATRRASVLPGGQRWGLAVARALANGHTGALAIDGGRNTGATTTAAET